MATTEYYSRMDLPGHNSKYYKIRISINGRWNIELKAEWDIKIYDTQIRRHLHIKQGQI